jgi:hypothetical protein
VYVTGIAQLLSGFDLSLKYVAGLQPSWAWGAGFGANGEILELYPDLLRLMAVEEKRS